MELLAIVRSFEEWRPHLIGATQLIRVLMDHKNLEYFATKRQFNQRQVRWSGFIAQFQWYAEYRPGRLGGKPDALTQRSRDLPKEGDERLVQQVQTLLKPENYTVRSERHRKSFDHDTIRVAELAPSSSPPPAPTSPSPHPTYFESLLSAVYVSDPFPREVLELLRTGARHCKNRSLAEYSKAAGRQRYRSKLYIPAFDNLGLHVLRDAHDAPTAGHPGRSKTLELIAREYFWPGMRKDVVHYVRNCHPCRQSKACRQSPFRILKPNPV